MTPLTYKLKQVRFAKRKARENNIYKIGFRIGEVSNSMLPIVYYHSASLDLDHLRWIYEMQSDDHQPSIIGISV